MLSLKSVDELVEKFINWHRTNTVEEVPIALRDLLTHDRQATADVLCALLADMKGVYSAKDAIEKAQDIIRATLSNKNL